MVIEFDQKVENYINDLNLTRNLQFSQKNVSSIRGTEESQLSSIVSKTAIRRTSRAFGVRHGGKNTQSVLKTD